MSSDLLDRVVGAGNAQIRAWRMACADCEVFSDVDPDGAHSKEWPFSLLMPETFCWMCGQPMFQAARFTWKDPWLKPSPQQGKAWFLILDRIFLWLAMGNRTDEARPLR